MDYRRVDPDMGKLRSVALEVRPDIRSRRASLSQREADLKLAKALRIPDVTIGAGYSVQQRAAGTRQPADGNLEFGRTVAAVQSQSGRDRAGRSRCAICSGRVGSHGQPSRESGGCSVSNLLQSRRLVEAYLAGVLEDARSTFTIVERAYITGRGHHSRSARCGPDVPHHSTELHQALFSLSTQSVSIGEFRRAGDYLMRSVSTRSQRRRWCCSCARAAKTGAGFRPAASPAEPVAAAGRVIRRANRNSRGRLQTGAARVSAGREDRLW